MPFSIWNIIFTLHDDNYILYLKLKFSTFIIINKNVIYNRTN